VPSPAPGEAAEHLNEPEQEASTIGKLRGCADSADAADIEDGCALHG
jgi:hypothetical protein